MLLLGYDVGGTKVEAAVVRIGAEGEYEVLSQDREYKKIQVLARERCATERDNGYASILENMAKLTHDTVKSAGVNLSEISAMGMGLPGSIHPRTQKYLSGNTLIFKGKHVAHDLAQILKFKKPVFSENDANCFTLAEGMCGAGLEYMKQSQKEFAEIIGLGIILGTGCGGGVLVNGHLLRGKQGGGAELGHSLLKSNGHACFCGNMGCAEQYLSGPALEASFMRRRYERIQHVASSHDIFKLALQGEPVAMAVISRYRDYLSTFLGNLASIFDPDYYVLGGGLSDQEMIYSGLSQKVSQKAFLKGDDIPIYKSKMGSSGGVIGAAMLPILDQLNKH